MGDCKRPLGADLAQVARKRALTIKNPEIAISFRPQAGFYSKRLAGTENQCGPVVDARCNDRQDEADGQRAGN